MKIEIEKLIELDIFGLFLCSYLYENKTKELEEYCKSHKLPTNSIKLAIKNEYLTSTSTNDIFTISNLQLTDKFENEFIEKKVGVEEWIDEYYNCFPKGVTSIAGYPIRTDKADCLKKMIKFIKEFGHSKGVILTATKNYLNIQKRTNYSHCKQSNYLIYKDNLSVLSGLCEIIKDKISGNSEEETGERFEAI